ncbi:12562_t:CDS:2 [Entrophospora sp. SA101]|nr:12562_t:CDS:2 [Entrophospora sp. SA101]
MFDEEEKEPLIIFECLMAADELLLDEFIDYTQTLLLNKHIQWLKDNLPIIFRITFNTNALKKLQDFCLDHIRKYPNLLFDLDEFLLLPEDCLEQLLKDDELEMEEMSDHKYALNYWRSIGPSFGKFDLLMENNIIKFKHKSYHPNIMPIDNGYARIEDYEVFQVVRKATVLSPSSSTIINANSTSTDNII